MLQVQTRSKPRGLNNNILNQVPSETENRNKRLAEDTTIQSQEHPNKKARKEHDSNNNKDLDGDRADSNNSAMNKNKRPASEISEKEPLSKKSRLINNDLNQKIIGRRLNETNNRTNDNGDKENIEGMNLNTDLNNRMTITNTANENTKNTNNPKTVTENKNPLQVQTDNNINRVTVLSREYYIQCYREQQERFYMQPKVNEEEYNNNKIRVYVANKYDIPVKIKRATIVKWFLIIAWLREENTNEDKRISCKIMDSYIRLDLILENRYIVTERKCNFNVNDNEHNSVKRIRYGGGSPDENLRVNINQSNLIACELTTQKNINTRNEVLNVLSSGKIIRGYNERERDIKLRSRGIITKFTRKLITEKLKIRPNKKRLINKVCKLLNEAFIEGIERAMRIHKIENEKLRKEEGVDIRKRYPRAVRKKPNPDTLEGMEGGEWENRGEGGEVWDDL